MPLSVADIDWTQLTSEDRKTLEDVIPRLEDGYSIREIADQLDVDAGDLELAWENLAARVMALSGRVELPPLTDEEFEALVQSIEALGQRYPILRGSPSSGMPGEIIDGRHRMRACARLGIKPWIVDVDGDADQLRSLGLVLQLARRHVSTSSRRGIVKAELLRDPNRSDRAIAVFVGVTHPTVAAVRRELEATGQVERLTTRVGLDGKPQTAQRTPSEPQTPRERKIKVSVPTELFETWVGSWVECRAFRLAERQAGVYELEVQLLDAELAGAELVDAIKKKAAELAERHGTSPAEAIAELLRAAREVFAREITTADDLTRQEAEWILSRVDVLTGARS